MTPRNNVRIKPMSQNLLSPNDAAKYLDLSIVTLAKWRCYQIPNTPPWIKMGRSVKYRVEDLDAWIEENRHESASTSQPTAGVGA